MRNMSLSVMWLPLLGGYLAANACALAAQESPPGGRTELKTSSQDRKAAARALREGNELSAKGTEEATRGAVGKYEEALRLWEAEGNKRQQAETMSQLASALEFLGDHQRAVQLFERALERWKTVREYESEATTLIRIGDIHFAQGEPEKALPYYKDAFPLWGKKTFWQALATAQEDRFGLVSRYGQAVTLNCIAQAYLVLGDTESAAKPLQDALHIWNWWLDYPYGKAVTLQNIGYMHYLKGDREEALKRYNQALKLYRPRGTLSKVAGVLIGAAILGLGAADQRFSRAGLLKAAGALALSTTFWFRQPGADLLGEATTLNNMGLVYESTGDSKQALECYERALAISQESGNRIGQALSSANLSGVYATLAITGAPESDEDAARAIDNLEHALNLFMTNRSTTGLSITLQRIGTFNRAPGGRGVPLKSLDSALELSRSMGDRRAQAITLTNIGELRANSHDDVGALDAFQQAEELARTVGDYRTEAFAKSNIGRVYEKRGERARALELYDQSISLHERARSAADLDEVRTRFAEQSATIYRRAVRLHAESGDIRTAFDLSERARARTFLDQMGRERGGVWSGAGSDLIQEEQKLAGELAALERQLRSAPPEDGERLNSRIQTKQDAYQSLLIRLKAVNPEYASLVTVDPLTCSQIQELLDRQTTLLSYFVADEETAEHIGAGETLAFVVTKDDLQMVHLPVKQKDLENEIRMILAGPTTTPTPALRNLYGWLVARLEPYLNTDVVGIIPHSVLHRLPFPALTDGLRYLGEKHAVFTLPSGSILRFLQGKRKPFANSILAVAYSNPKAIGLPRLPYADQEVTEIARLYGTVPLIGARANKSTIESRAGDSAILHIAAHALNETQPNFSHLVLAGDAEGDDLLYVHDIYRMRLKSTSLVVLSACEAALGKLTKGDEIVGLSRAFIYAGTPTVISSLWQVPDDSTKELMIAFYRRLRGGEAAIYALRGAQAEVRAQRPHPYYWAGFVLNGDPGIRPTGAGDIR